ncbi:hypothetical protein RN001_006199 [Aquatica leii]|uniref:Uncharacterized protein n=1 Tax=Aquatica leii TaxID=1421715 RepID=A0AAN7P7K7_9COLE|nr:hypothetical protein RN001_006199 [Aquatica leii]
MVSDWRKYSVKIISKECHQFKVASAKASKALFCSDVDSNTETKLPDKQQRKLNKRKISSTDEEEETDEGSQVKVANYPVPPNLNGVVLQKTRRDLFQIWLEKKDQKISVKRKHVMDTITSAFEDEQGIENIKKTIRRFCNKLETRWKKCNNTESIFLDRNSDWLDEDLLELPSKAIADKVVDESLPSTMHSESNLEPDDGISTFGHHPTSSYQLLELVTNNLTDSRIQFLESKMDDFIKLAVMNNRLIKEQKKSLDVIDGKLNQLLNRGTEADLPIQNQTFGVDDERILEFKKIIPLSTQDDFNKLEEILFSESNEFKDFVVI